MPKMPVIKSDRDPAVEAQLEEIRGSEIDQKHLAKCLMDAFGGAEGLAKKTAKLYRDSKAGSLAQNAIIRTVFNMISAASSKDQAPDDNFDNMQLDDMAKLFPVLLKRANEQ